MKKKKTGIIKLLIFSGKASPAPPIGPSLGQKGINIISFCKKFNDETKDINPSSLLPVLIIVYLDKNFDFFIKKSSLTYVLKNIIFKDIPSFSEIKSITLDKVIDLVNFKLVDFNTVNYYSSFKIVLGVIKSFGIKFDF